MLVCPWCNSSSWKVLRKSVTNPTADEFQCSSCGRKFYRYENTEYEREGDPKHKQED